MKRHIAVACVLIFSSGFMGPGRANGQSAARSEASAAPSKAATVGSGGSTAPAEGVAGTAIIPKGALGPQYVDASFGFAVRPLAGATMDRRKRTVEKQLQLAQFVRLDVAWSLAIRLWANPRPIDATAAKEALALGLAVQYPDAEVTRAEEIRIAQREAVRLAASFSAEGQTWLRQQAVIQLRPKEHIVVLLTTPGDDREVAAQTFDQLLESFQVVRTELQQKQIDAALDRGIALRAAVAADASRITDRIIAEPVYVRLSREGRSVGLVEIREAPARIAGEEGIHTLQQAWLFNPDESVQFLQEEKFVAADLSYDEWRNMSQLMPSKRSDPKQRLIVNVEAGIRRGDQLIVKYGGTSVDDKQDKTIEVEPSYASAALPLLLPRLVDLKTPELYAFSMYDSERRGMNLRTFRVTGPEQVLVGGRRVSGYKIEDSEGLLPPINEIVVDGQGRLLRLSSGPVEMAVASQKELEDEFGDRIRATQKQFRENAGLPEPSAQPSTGSGSGGRQQSPDAVEDSRRSRRPPPRR